MFPLYWQKNNSSIVNMDSVKLTLALLLHFQQVLYNKKFNIKWQRYSLTFEKLSEMICIKRKSERRFCAICVYHFLSSISSVVESCNNIYIFVCMVKSPYLFLSLNMYDNLLCVLTLQSFPCIKILHLSLPKASFYKRKHRRLDSRNLSVKYAHYGEDTRIHSISKTPCMAL